MTEPALCNFDSIEETDCMPTQLSTIWSRLGLKISFFGVVFYWSNWAFVGFFLIGLIVAGCRYVIILTDSNIIWHYATIEYWM